MRKLVLLFTALIFGTLSINASTTDDKVATRNAYQYNNSFIFVENGITFSVFPDGEFDFYIDNRLGHHNSNITFNSGYDYSPYAQYDDYGAIIQVENVPVYYDYYGRVSNIGSVGVTYRNGRVYRVGGMYVYYNHRGSYDYHTGYINRYNRHYVYRPFHRLFLRPSINLCLVFNKPYRRYYAPTRYTYYSPYRYNTRRTYAKIGREHRYNKTRQSRSKIYRNDKRVATRSNTTRSNRTVNRNTYNRNSTTQRGYTKTNRSNSRRTSITKREISRTPRSTSVARTTRSYKKPANRSSERTVATRNNNTQRKSIQRPTQRTSRSTSATRTTRSYKKPANRSSGRTVATRNNNTQRKSIQRPTQRVSRSSGISTRSSKQRSVSKTPSRSRNTVSRSASSRRVTSAPSKSSRSNTRSTTTRSSRRQ